MRLKSSTLDDLEGHCQPAQSAILETAGLFVIFKVLPKQNHLQSAIVQQFYFRSQGYCSVCHKLLTTLPNFYEQLCNITLNDMKLIGPVQIVLKIYFPALLFARLTTK